MIGSIEKAVATGRRLNRDQAIALLGAVPLGPLMDMAFDRRVRRHGDAVVTFVVDTNPNYTNVCQTRCAFCAFCRPPDHPEAYTLTAEQLAERVQWAWRQGATTALIQGGHNPQVTLDDWLGYIRTVRQACPGIHIHPFSPAEYVFMARKEDMPVERLLRILWDEGIRTIPGGGAEILCEPVRKKIAPAKARTDQWLAVCETAHEIGFRTTATMMYGHVETDADIADHLLALRQVQDRTGGFTSFIPWSFKPGTTALAAQVPAPAHPARYVRIIAVARLVLDNFDHVQSSWFSESVRAGQLGLLAGADDFGGVLVEENVLQQAGHSPKATVEKVKTIIRRAGFTPAQRDSDYKVIETFEPPQSLGPAR